MDEAEEPSQRGHGAASLDAVRRAADFSRAAVTTSPPSQVNSSGRLDALAVDPAVLRGQQERDRPADVVGDPYPTEGRLASDHGVELGIVPYRAPSEVGRNGSWGDRVHRN